MTDPKIKNGRLVLPWGRVFSYYAWPLVVFLVSFPMLILALGKFSFYSDLSPFTFLIPLLFTLTSIFCMWKMYQKLQFRSILRSSVPEIINDLEGIKLFLYDWHIVCRTENMLVMQPHERSHWRWSKEKIHIRLTYDRLEFLYLRNPSLTCGLFCSWVKNLRTENEFARDVMDVNSERVDRVRTSFRRGPCRIEVHL